MFDKRFREMLMMDFATKNQGSGLLNNNTNATSGLLENTGGFFGNLGNINPNILLGANIIGQGIQGRDPFSSFIPAVQQTGQVQSQFMQMEEMKRKMEENKKARETADKQRSFFESLPPDHPFKNVAEAFPSAAAQGIINLELKKITDATDNKNAQIKAANELVKTIREDENNFFKNYNDDKQVETFNESTTQLKKMLAALEQDTGAGDVAAIFAFMKTLDPNSVVRESEFEVAEGTGGSTLLSFEKAFQKWQKLKTGERLTDRERENFKKAAISFHNASEGAIDNIRSGYETIAENRGLNIENIFVDNDLRPLFVQSTVQDGPPTVAPTKITGRLPKGTRLVDYANGEYFFRLPDGKIFKIRG
jgi:hypothetical protein